MASLVKQVNDSFNAIDRIGEPKRKKTKKQKRKYVYEGKTKKAYISHCCTFVKWAREKYDIKKLTDLTPYIGQHYIELLKHENHSAYTIQSVKSALEKLESAIRVNYHKRRKIVPHDIEIPHRKLHERKGRKAYTPSQLSQILAYSWEKNPEAAKAFDLQAKFGLRVSEVLKLQKCDVIFDQKLLVVWRGKGGMLRTVNFPEEEEERESAEKLLAHLTREGSDHDYIFPELNTQKLYRVLGYACQKAGIEHAKTHNLRHTYAVNNYKEKLNKGKSDQQARSEISKAIGHRRRDVVVSYVPNHFKYLRGGI